MYIHGSFEDIMGREVEVRILTAGNDNTEKEIGVDADGLYFTDDPVEIKAEVNDTFDHVLTHSASVRLLTREFIPELFSADVQDTKVNIFRDGVCLFAGFVTPMAYSQDYVDSLDELELNCVDVLSALRERNYMNIGKAGVDYDTVKAAAGTRTLWAIVSEMLEGMMDGLFIDETESWKVMSDGTKSLSNAAAERYKIFERVQISSNLMLGDSEKDVWDQKEVLTEIMRYLNLHIVQEGYDFYIFDWYTLKQSGAQQWCDLRTESTQSISKQTVTLTNELAVDTGTQIDIEDVYNKIQIKCDVKELKDIIEDPFDDKALYSPYASNQLYLTEYQIKTKAKHAGDKFEEMLETDQPASDDEATVCKWYMQVMRHKNWKFPYQGDETDDLVDHFMQTMNDVPILQETLPNWLGTHMGGGFFSLGCARFADQKKDNSLVNKVNMENIMYLSIATERRCNNSQVEPYGEVTEEEIKANIPLAVYTGPKIGVVMSPNDSRITNYIVINGEIIQNASGQQSGKAWTIMQGGTYGIVKRDSSEKDSYYYTRKYYSQMYSGEPQTGAFDRDRRLGLYPNRQDNESWMEYERSYIGDDGTDTISKVAYLACMLVVGDKVVIEDGENCDGQSNGRVTDFHWYTYKTREQCSSDDEYYEQCFYIGIDPKIGDKLFSTEFEIGNNIEYTLGIDAKGMAIPVPYDAQVYGDVTFKILGIVNSEYNQYNKSVKRRFIFWRHTSWSQVVKPFMQGSSVIISGFTMTLMSDNGKLTKQQQKDLVYMSDTDESYINKKELTFKIVSALTYDECQELGVASMPTLSMPYDSTTRHGLKAIYDRTKSESGKPEQLYVDSYYREYHEPRVVLSQNVRDEGVKLVNRYTLPAIGKTFYVEGVSRKLIDGVAKLKLKEV